MAAAGWGAAAQSAAQVHSAFIAAGAATDQQKFATQFASDTNVINRTREDNRMQRAVADAKAAGLHPLFALGSAGAGSASIAMSPTPTAGGSAAAGIAAAGKTIGEGIRGYAKGKRTARLDAAAAELHALAVRSAQGKIQLDDLEAQRRASDLAVSTQRQFWGDSDTGIGGVMEGQPSDTKIFPYGTRAGIPLELRPRTDYGLKSRPLRSEVIADDGYRYRIIDPDTGDELSQADLFQQMVLRHTRKARLAPGRELRIQFNRAAAAIKRKWRQMNSGKSRHYRSR